MKTSIIIVCYNEKKYIEKTVSNVIALPIDKEVIIVDDGSNDGSKELINNVLRHKVDKVILKANEGKGSALKAGFKIATGDILIPQDADNELDPNDILKVIEPIESNLYEVSSGSRFLNKSKGCSLIYIFANRVFSKMASFFYKQKITDVNTCYIAFKRKLLPILNLKENDFAINEELFGKISNLKIKIKEIPINYYPRSKRDGKKISFKDGIKCLFSIFRYRFKYNKSSNV